MESVALSCLAEIQQKNAANWPPFLLRGRWGRSACPIFLALSRFTPLAARSSRPSPNLFFVSGYPRHTTLILPSSSKRSVSSTDQLSLTSFASDFAFRVHRPQYRRRLGPLSAGRPPTGKPVNVEAKASTSIIFIKRESATFLWLGDPTRKSSCNLSAEIRNLLRVVS